MKRIKKAGLDKKIGFVLVCLVVISLVALGIATAGYLQKRVEQKTTIINQPVMNQTYAGPVYAGAPVGYIIKFENGVKFYFAGDTALYGDMKFIVGDYYQPDVAFLPIGNIFTMDAEDAAYATTLINSTYVVPMHYHTFPMLAQNATEFVNRVNTYRQEGKTKTEPLVLEYGVEKDILGIKVTWLGHGTFLFDSVKGTRLIVDPWLQANPDCPGKYKNITSLNKVDMVLYTHAHLDHLSMSDLTAIIKQYNPVILANFELRGYLEEKLTAMGMKYIIPMMNKGGHITKEVLQKMVPPGTNVDFMQDMVVTAVYANHSSSPP